MFPEAVVTNPDGYKAVAYSKLIGPLIEAIKSQQQVIEQQKKVHTQEIVRLQRMIQQMGQQMATLTKELKVIQAVDSKVPQAARVQNAAWVK